MQQAGRTPIRPACCSRFDEKPRQALTVHRGEPLKPEVTLEKLPAQGAAGKFITMDINIISRRVVFNIGKQRGV